MAKAKTSVAFADLAGSAGSLVVARTRSGLVIRQKPRYRRPTSPGQAQAALRMKQASETWNTLSCAQAAAWNQYGESLIRHSAFDGQAYRSTGFNAFVALSVKILQMDPEATLPMSPPQGEFLGDSILLSMGTTSGAIVFTATGANSPGVVTELMLQRMPNIRRKVGKQYKAEAFVAFTAGSLSHILPAEPGAYAGAYQFVEASTGRVTGILPLPPLEVA